MAPPKSLRTYSRGNNSSINCIEAMNILFAKNLTERKLHRRICKGKNRLQIKELPKKIKSVLSDESSLHVNFNDTFDKLLKNGPNNVKSTNDMSVKIIAKKKSTSVIKHFNKFINISPGFSPMISKLRSFKSRSQDSEEGSSYSWFKHPTPPGVNVTKSLEIEVIGKSPGKSKKKVNNIQKKSQQNSSRDCPILLRSHTKLPDIVVTDSTRHKNDIDGSLTTKESNKSNKKDEKKNNESSLIGPNLSYNPIFTNSVREKIVMHSSTPLVSSKTMRFVKHPISPIKTVNDETDDINEEINSSILKSLEEIKSWDLKFPNIDQQNNKLNSLSATEDFKGFDKQEVDMKKDSFVTVRGRKMNRMTLDSEKNTNKSNKTKSFTLEEFELFSNKSNPRSFKLEDFERFHNSFTEQLSSRLTQSQVNKLNSIALKDFESFYTAYQNKMSLHRDSFLFKSNRTFNYVTNRKHRLSRKPVNKLTKKYLRLSKEFDLKNLVVVLDNVLVKNRTEKIKKSGSLCHTALMKSIIQKQPVINLTRLSIKQPTFKAKDRVGLNSYKVCRKFSSNSTASNRSDTLPCSDIFDLGQLFINITRMPLSGSSHKIANLTDDSVKPKERNLEQSTIALKGSDKYKENEVKSDSTSEKENDKSVNRKCKKNYGRSKSTDPTHEKNWYFSSPDHKTFKSADYIPQESRPNSQKVRTSTFSHTNQKSKLINFEETDSEDEGTGIQLSLFSKSFKKHVNNKANCKKKYVAKILVGSVSDTEVELKNTDSSVIREISKNLRSWSQENVASPRNTTELGNSFKKRMPSRVLRSHNNLSLNCSDAREKTEIRLHRPSYKDLAREVNSRLYETRQPDSSISYRAEDMSNSILFDDTEEVSSATPQLKDLEVNLTIHKSWDKCDTISNNVTGARKSKKLTKQGNEKNNLGSNKTDNSKSKPKHKSSNSNCEVSNADVSTNDTSISTGPTTRLSAKKPVAVDHKKSEIFCKSDATDPDADIIESSITSANGDCFKAPMDVVNRWKQKIPNLKGGKSWRRSLLVHKRGSVIDLTHDLDDVSSYSTSAVRQTSSARQTNSARQNSLLPQNLPAKRQSIKIVPLCDPRLSRRRTALQTYAQTNLSAILDDSITDLTIPTPRKCKLSLENSLPLITAKDIVLKRCGQTDPQPFEKLYPKSLLKDCKKIGEGVYGEVFLYTNPSGDTTVMKVIPIEGSKIVNQERQKKFDEILSEIIIASELSKLRKYTTNQTSAFSEVQRICCVKGKYPQMLLDLWDAYDSSKGSENDHPEVFEDDQLYIVLDLANGGRDLEAFVFNNALQAVSMLKQVACALAVAEQQMQFEHRDLHWGNVLLKSVDKNKKVICKHKGETIESHTQGVEATIIDFTLSRIVHDGVVIFNDLGQDPDLFVAEGDYQFEIYRLMREKNSNNWQTFEPHTNVLWLHYIIEKSVTALRYKNVKTKVHKKNIGYLKEYEKAILKFNSVSEFVSEYY